MNKSNRTKATDIPPNVKKVVEERDNHRCVFCGNPYAKGEMHYIRRSQGGLGIEQNLLTGCRECHYQFDEGQAKELLRERAKKYLKSIYPDWDEENLIYNKWKEFKYQ